MSISECKTYTANTMLSLDIFLEQIFLSSEICLKSSVKYLGHLALKLVEEQNRITEQGQHSQENTLKRMLRF
ncbi:hypothetical protein T06_6902 [Trichinella sp. T6]|nr:hypothetical protein T06_6902 [Trichinella sp. T6]